MLAEQLAKELRAGASPEPSSSATTRAACAHRSPSASIAGDPSEEDDAFVRAAEKAEIPIVIVQLWPQENWRAPFVLSPFVVECKTGEGFPLAKIAELIATAADDPTALAAGIPVLEQPVGASGQARRDRSLGAPRAPWRAGRSPRDLRSRSSRSASSSRLRALEDAETQSEEQMPVVAGTAAAAIAASYGFRQLARVARRRLPDRVADAAVAAAGTWAVAELFRRLEARGLI